MAPDDQYLDAARRHNEGVVKFLSQLVELPSFSRDEARVTERIGNEMTSLGFDEVTLDALGTVVGRFGAGPTKIVFDSHIDTVRPGDLRAWKTDPFRATIRNGTLYGRGASDNKAAIASMVHAVGIMRELNLDASAFTLYVIGSVQEEDCDGIGLESALTEKVPDAAVVVLGEATNLQVYRGHRGRVEFEVEVTGRAAHASAPERGVNAIYKMSPIIGQIEALNARLTGEAFLGKGTVVVSGIDALSPSLNAVPDGCTIYLDRRLALGDTVDSALAELEALPAVQEGQASVRVRTYAETAYTGTKVSQPKYFPTWITEIDHPAVAAGVVACQRALGRTPEVGRWVFSTNGVASAGRLHIPTIGFGPANELYAHSPEDQCPIDDLWLAQAWYAAFPSAYIAQPSERSRESHA